MYISIYIYFIHLIIHLFIPKIGRCRSICLAQVGCKGVSATPVDGHFLCRLVGKTVDISVFRNTIGATFIFWESKYNSPGAISSKYF